jgi:hypothetical protein
MSKLLPTISGFPLGEGSHRVKGSPGQDSVGDKAGTQHGVSTVLEHYSQALTQGQPLRSLFF